MTLEQLTELFGWIAILNLGVLCFATLMLTTMKDWVTSIHSKMFGIDKEQLKLSYFNYLANYKIVTVVFACAPWLALKIMTS